MIKELLIDAKHNMAYRCCSLPFLLRWLPSIRFNGMLVTEYIYANTIHYMVSFLHIFCLVSSHTEGAYSTNNIYVVPMEGFVRQKIPSLSQVYLRRPCSQSIENAHFPMEFRPIETSAFTTASADPGVKGSEERGQVVADVGQIEEHKRNPH